MTAVPVGDEAASLFERYLSEIRAADQQLVADCLSFQAEAERNPGFRLQLAMDRVKAQHAEMTARLTEWFCGRYEEIGS